MKYLRYAGVILRRVFLIAVVAFALLGFLHAVWPILLAPESTVSKFLEAVLIILALMGSFILYAFW
jgi:hypothetical protein